jgi:hypothetical protein
MNRTLLLLAGSFVFAAGLTLGRHLPQPRVGGKGPDAEPGDFLLVTYPDPAKPTGRDSRTLVVSGAVGGGGYPDAAPPGGWAVTFEPGTPDQRTYLATPRNPDAE